MNADHASSVYGMVLESATEKRGVHISEAKMKSVALEGCTFSYVVCCGDRCEMKTSELKFRPPLRSASEVKVRLIQIHHQVLSPKVHWLVTDPVPVIVIIAIALLGFGTYGFGGRDGLTDAIESEKRLNEAVVGFLGSAETFASLTVFFWYIAMVAHLLEGCYVAYHCIKTLKLHLGSTMLWFYMVLCTGYPIASRLLEFVKIQTSAQQAEGKKRH
jgi:hypothetical protein